MVPRPLHPLFRAAASLRSRAARHPRAALAAVAILPIVAALLLIALDLFYAIPWPIRKGFGWAVFAGVAAIGAWRLGTVRPTDRWPSAPEGSGGGGSTVPALLMAVTTALVAWPLLSGPDEAGRNDWSYYTGHFEALRRSVLEWHQFPWWHPWCCGGFPLAGNPQLGAISPDVGLILALGPSLGLRIAAIGWTLLAAEGARRLALPWVGDPWAAAAAGVIYALNGGAVLGLLVGYYIPASFWVLPWVLLELQRLDRPGNLGLRLGAWLAIAALTMIHYLTVYAIVVAGVAGLRLLRAARPADRRAILLRAAAAGGVVLLVAGWRLAVASRVLADFPRDEFRPGSLGLVQAVMVWLSRPDAVELTTTVHLHWESNVYVGPIVLALFLASLRYGFRWWHVLAVVSYWLAVGGAYWFQPSYWLAHLPLFRTMHAVTRWRLVTALAVGIAAADALARLRRSPRRWVRAAALGLIAAVAADYVAYGFRVLPVAFDRKSPDPEIGPPTGSIVQLHAVEPELPAIRRGYGVIEGYEPQLGYRRDRATARLWKGHPDYVAEHWTADGPVVPISWSPNRIVLQVEPRQRVQVNQNPGSWWLANGRPLRPDLRAAELTEPFVAVADDRGRLVLEIRPVGLGLGWALHGVGAALVIGSTAILRRRTAGRDLAPTAADPPAVA